ncbi:hypothetical protein L917_02676, partial [Phytophthora nicotianae]
VPARVVNQATTMQIRRILLAAVLAAITLDSVASSSHTDSSTALEVSGDALDVVLGARNATEVIIAISSASGSRSGSNSASSVFATTIVTTVTALAAVFLV